MSSSSPPPIPTPVQGSYASPPVTIVLTVILLIFFFVGFFSVYFCRCFSQNVLATWNNRINPPGMSSRPNATQNVASPGLDVQIIETFPKFKYSAVKDFRQGKIGLECAICLSEFADDDFLRLLTICYHVFHQDCVDLWLESHKTCPVCRAALDSPPDEKSLAKVSDNNDDDNNNNISTNSPVNEVHLHHNASDGSVRISIMEEDDENEIHTQRNGSLGPTDTNKNETSIQSTQSNIESVNRRRAMAEKISKCHSTGHSIFRNKNEDMDKYTLRLPDHVKEHITKGHHHQCAKSCTIFGEYTSNSAKQGNGFGEMSGPPNGDHDDKV